LTFPEPFESVSEQESWFLFYKNSL